MASKLDRSLSSARSTMTPSPSEDNALSDHLRLLWDLMYSASEVAIVGASMRKIATQSLEFGGKSTADEGVNVCSKLFGTFGLAVPDNLGQCTGSTFIIFRQLRCVLGMIVVGQCFIFRIKHSSNVKSPATVVTSLGSLGLASRNAIS